MCSPSQGFYEENNTKMKIYTIFDYYPDGYIKNIHSIYLSKEKAQSVSNELREKARQEYIHDIMYDKDSIFYDEQMTEDEATDLVNNNFSTWLYEVQEM